MVPEITETVKEKKTKKAEKSSLGTAYPDNKRPQTATKKINTTNA